MQHQAPPVVYATLDSVRAWSREALEKAGLAPEGARIVTEVQLEASLRGQPTHNIGSIPRYARRLAAGVLNGTPQIRIEAETATSALFDGDNGPGQWVATVAMEWAIRKARECGIALVGVRRSNHFGAAGHYAWVAACQDLIGLVTTNGPAVLAPTGGVTPTFGNDPVGAGIPAGKNPSLLLDIALSVAPRGKIGLQLAEGKLLEPGWILDAEGNPSVDLADLAAGLSVPIGGHKGYGLAVVMETLAGVLTGAGFCLDHGRRQMKELGRESDIGHFMLVLNPKLFMPVDRFKHRVDRMIAEVKSSRKAAGVVEVLLPGERELREREKNLGRGVPLTPSTLRDLLKYGRDAGVEAPLEYC